MRAIVADLRFGVRSLRRRPAYALVAVATLGVGMGASSAMFSIVNGVVLLPLPFPEPDRLVRVYDTDLARGRTSSTSSPANFVDWRDQQRAFAGLEAYVNGELALTDVQPPESFRGAAVSAGWFGTLGTLPALGRPFTRDEETFGNHRVAIVSHGLWQNYLGGDPGAVGRSLSLEGESYTVVGVMPPGFAFPTPDAQLWTPLAFDFDVSTSRGVHFITVIGRLAPGASVEAAEADLSVLMGRLAEAHPEQLAGWGVRLESLHQSIVGDVRPRILLFFGAVGLVLLVAVVNVANLAMARAVTRFREFAVRAAMGAGRWRLVRQLMAESVLLSAAGGIVGLLLATLTLRAVAAFAGGSIPRLENVSIDAWALAFAAMLSLAIGAALGVVPAIRAVRPGLSRVLREGGRGAGTGRGQHRLRGGFVVAQIALALLLAVGAGLLVRSFASLTAVDPGYRTARALTATVAAPSSRYPNPADRSRLFRDLTERLGAIPGVVSAAATTQLPLEGYGINFSYWLAGDDVPPSERPNGDFRVVTPGYFETMGIPMLAGRPFTAGDAEDAPPVIVIDEALARLHFVNSDPIGQQMVLSYGEEVPRTIVGVVGDVRQRALDAQPSPGYYLPLAQVTWSSMRFVLRASVAPASLAEPLRREVAAVDPLLAVRDVRTLDERFTASVGSPRFNTFLLAAFALVAVALAVSGIYSVMSYVVSQRTHEIGVRMALGARAGDVRRSVSWSGLRLAAIGVAIGLAAALTLTRVLSALLFGISPLDPVTFAAAPLAFLAIAWLSGYLPARRASGVDPVIALKAE